MSGSQDQRDIDAAAFRLMDDPGFKPLLIWWELQLTNGAVGPGPVCPYRLAMAQGDRQRLLAIRLRAGQHLEQQNLKRLADVIAEP